MAHSTAKTATPSLLATVMSFLTGVPFLVTRQSREMEEKERWVPNISRAVLRLAGPQEYSSGWGKGLVWERFILTAILTQK